MADSNIATLTILVGVGFGNENVVSEPQLYRINHPLRGSRNTELLNFEVYSTLYDILQLYYQFDASTQTMSSNMAYVEAGSSNLADAPDLPFTPGSQTILSRSQLWTSMVNLERRVAILESGNTNRI